MTKLEIIQQLTNIQEDLENSVNRLTLSIQELCDDIMRSNDTTINN